MNAGATSTPRLEVRGLSKSFAGVRVLSDARIALMPGEIHALVGQNGSGKSTLIKLISGVFNPDPGSEILVDGVVLGRVSPAKLQHHALAFVHQDLGLVPDLTVRDNVRVGRNAVGRFTRRIDKDADRHAVAETFDYLGVPINPEAPVASLTPSERVAVAIARALQQQGGRPGVIVFDESSRAIPHEAIEPFYDMVRTLAEQGTAVLFVSHDLKEVLSLAHRVTALRNGEVVETGVRVEDLDEAALTRLVLGRDGATGDLITEIPTGATGEALIELRGVAGGRVHDFTAILEPGTVVGVTGTIDSGILDLPALLALARPATGEFNIAGSRLDLSKSSINHLLRLGVVVIPQDRHRQGLATGLTVEENVTLPYLQSRSKPWFLGNRWRERHTDDVIEQYDVRPRQRQAVIATLSGGNQQKVMFGKWLMGQPRLLVIEEPTVAVDVGARTALLAATRTAAQHGSAVLLVSAEVQDLAAVSDRILILENGRVAREVAGPANADNILSAIFQSDLEAS